jgi:acyl-CoA thioesterase-1
MKNLLLLTLALLLTATVSHSAEKKTAPKKKPAPNPALAPIADVPGLPRVLLIGDSISIGYTLPVRELLKGKANVHRIPANGGPTISGLQNIDAWLGSSKWDVIHFNWGLHDLKYMGPNKENLADPKAATSHQQVPLADYEKNLETLVGKLKATGAKLIWRNTTPVPEGCAGRVPGDELKYNEAAARVMKQAGIMIEDLRSHSLKAPAGYQLPANVHYSPEGSKYLAEHVVAAIQSQLPKK